MHNWINALEINDLIDETLDPNRPLKIGTQLKANSPPTFRRSIGEEASSSSWNKPNWDKHEINVPNSYCTFGEEAKNTSLYPQPTSLHPSKPTSPLRSKPTSLLPSDALNHPALDTLVRQARADIDQSSLSTCNGLARQSQSRRALSTFDVKRALGLCGNEAAGRIMLSHPSIELDMVGKGEHDQYVPISSGYNEAGGTPKPIFSLPIPGQELFERTDMFARQRFDVILCVATALCVTAGAGWPHRRLSSAHILIRRGWTTPIAGGNDGGIGVEEAAFRAQTAQQLELERGVKVTNFRCPVSNGCPQECGMCRDYFNHELKSYGQVHIEQKFRQHGGYYGSNDVRFADAFGSANDAVADGVACDMVSFGSFVLWLYSGECLPATGDTVVPEAELTANISHVSWPIRYIVTDALALQQGRTDDIVSLAHTVDYLHALRDESVRPYSLGVLFMPGSSALRAMAFHALLAAARDGSPYAMVHLGKMCEQAARADRIDNSDKNGTLKKQNLRLVQSAYGLYAAAAKCGLTSAFMFMAGVQAVWNDPENPSLVVDGAEIRISIWQLFRCALRAALDGEEDGLHVLRRVAEKRKWSRAREVLDNLSDDDDDGMNEDDEIFYSIDNDNDDNGPGLHMPNHARLVSEDDPVWRVLAVVVDAAKCWRRGSGGIPCSVDEARRWLELAVAHSTPNPSLRNRARLELGLVERQAARSEESMHRAVELVRAVCGSPEDSFTKSSAQYWLGMWHHKGLAWRGVQIVQKDEDTASSLFQACATSATPDKEGMSFYSRVLRLGLGRIAKDEVAAQEWNRKARQYGSMSAHIRYGYDLEQDAQNLYKALVDKVSEGQRVENHFNRASDSSASFSRRLSGMSSGRRTSFSIRSNNSFLSNTALSQVSNESMDTSTKLHQHNTSELRSMVDLKLRRARQVLIGGVQRVRKKDGEQGYNPIPYWQWANIVAGNARKWAECAEGGAMDGKRTKREEEKKAFERRLGQEASYYLEEAKKLEADEGWKEHRVNYVEHDRYWIGLARSELQKERLPGRTGRQRAR